MQGSGAGFARTGHAMRLMERVAVAVQQREPALLVGETGTGKTALAQQLASQVRSGERLPWQGRHSARVHRRATALLVTCCSLIIGILRL